MRKELTVAELDGQHAELLPTKETLWTNFNWSSIHAYNASMALNVGSHYSSATSAAVQNISVSQH